LRRGFSWSILAIMNPHRLIASCLVLLVFTPAAFAQEGKPECQWAPATSKLTVVAPSGVSLAVEAPAGCGAFTKTACDEWKGPQGAAAVHFRAWAKKGGTAFEAFVALKKEGPAPVWSGLTGFQGEYGERQGTFFDYEPPGKDAKVLVPILYTLDERVKLCGFGLAPLDVKMYDPKSAAFRSVSFDRLRRWKRGEKAGWGGTGEAKATGPGKPVALQGAFEAGGGGGMFAGFVVFESSSSSLGPKNKVQTGAAVLSLADGDPLSGWIEGSGGDGAGEFVTAKTISSKVPFSALELSLAKGKGNNALKKFSITTDDGTVYAVTVPKDPRKSPGEKLVVAFPEPVESSCLSIVIDEVWPAPASSGNHTFIGEITPRTPVESPEGLAALADALVEAGSTAALKQILGALPPQASALVAKAWDVLDGATRRFLLDNIPGSLLEGEGGLDLVGKELAWILDRKQVSSEAINLLMQVGQSPAIVLPWFDAPPGQAEKEMAALVLTVAGFDEAAAWVIDFYLRTSPPDAVILDEGIGLLTLIRLGLKGPLASRADLPAGAGGGRSWCDFLEEGFFAPGKATEDYDPKKMVGLLHALLATGRADCAAKLAGGVWAAAGDFDTRYYILDLFKKLVAAGPCPACREQLEEGGIIQSALGVEDSHLKVAALEAASLVGDAGPVKTSVKALMGDSSPLVREKAVEVAGSLAAGDAALQKAILDAALGDFWPDVRRAAVAAASAVEAIPEEAMVAMLTDEAPDVRKNAIRLAVEKKAASQAVGKAIMKSAAAKAMRWDVREEASTAIGKLCIGGFEKQLEKIVEGGLYPDSTEAEIYAAAGAIASLGMLGWADAVGVLKLAALPGIRGELRLAAVEAMGSIGGPEAVEFLTELLEDADASVREASTAALERIKAKKKPFCKK
jgi:HEAT repeat protein